MPDGTPNPYIRTYAKDVAALQAQGAEAHTEEKQQQHKADGEREAVLARLRAKAHPHPVQRVHESTLLPSSMPTPVPAVKPVGADLPAPPVVPPPAPVAVPVPPPAPPPPVLRPAPIAPPPVPAAPVEAPTPIHTFSSDFADRIDKKEASAFSVLASQQDETRTAPQVVRTSRGPSKALLVTLASVVLVLLGAGGLYAAYAYVSSSHRPVALGPSVSSLIFADDRQQLSGEGPQLMSAIAASASAALPEGQVRVLYLAHASTTADGKTVTTPLAGGQLIGSLQLAAPDILLRNIAPESTVGIVHAGEETRAFFILKVLSYERTFAGMLQWEGTMQSSLGILYPAYAATFAPVPKTITTTKVVNGKLIVSTTTATSTTAVVNPPHFVDEVASNHDVRALKDDQGRTILLYGYQDKTTLVIARNEATFAEILNRLSATKQQ